MMLCGQCSSCVIQILGSFLTTLRTQSLVMGTILLAGRASPRTAATGDSLDPNHLKVGLEQKTRLILLDLERGKTSRCVFK